MARIRTIKPEFWTLEYDREQLRKEKESGKTP